MDSGETLNPETQAKLVDRNPSHKKSSSMNTLVRVASSTIFSAVKPTDHNTKARRFSVAGNQLERTKLFSDKLFASR